MPSQLLPADKVVQLCGIVGSILSKVVELVKGGGILGALGLISDVGDLRGINPQQLLDQVKDLDADERQACLVAFKKAFVIKDKTLETKIKQGSDILEKAIELVLKVVDQVEQGVALVNEVKALVGAP